MANSFDFELNANEQVSAAIQQIDEVLKKLNPMLEKTTDGLKLGGSESLDNLDDLGSRLDRMARHAKDGVQFIGDLVPPLKMVGGLTLGLGGVATAIHIVKNNLTEFANAGYQIDTFAKNVSMTTTAFQELTGAMIENGSTREAAENAIVDTFDKATDAAYGFNTPFLSVLNSKGIGISKTKEGLADVGKLLVDINRVMQDLPPGEQALFIKKLDLSPDLLSYLRNTSQEVQRLKDQAQRDGLIYSDQDIQNAMAFKMQLNQISAGYDGILLRSQAYLGKGLKNIATPEIRNEFDSYKLHNQDSESSFYHGDQTQDILHRARRDESFKKELSFSEGAQLALGKPGESLQAKLNAKYLASWKAQQLNNDLGNLTVPPLKKIINPLDQAMGNTPEQKRLSQLESQHNLPSGLLDKLWSAESSRGKNLLSNKGAEGPFQFMPATGRDYGLNNRADRMDFTKSSDAAARYLADLLKMFGGDVRKAVAAYNWGPGRVNELGIEHAPAETRDYLQKIMPGLPLFQPQGGLNDSGNNDYNASQPVNGYSSIFSEQTVTASELGEKGHELVSAISTLNQTLQENKMQIELTLVDSKTGERKTIAGTGGGRVSGTLEF